MSALYTALVEGETKESLAVMVCELREERARLRAALNKIDEKGNGISLSEKQQTVYVTLMRCGSIARDVLRATEATP